MGGGVETVTGIVTWLVDLDLTNFEYVNLDLTKRCGQQHRSGLDRLGITRGPEYPKLRYLTMQSVHEIKIGGSAVRAG